MSYSTKERILSALHSMKNQNFSDASIQAISIIVDLLTNNDEYELPFPTLNKYYSGLIWENGKFYCSNCHKDHNSKLLLHTTLEDDELSIYECKNCGNYVFVKEESELNDALPSHSIH